MGHAVENYENPIVVMQPGRLEDKQNEKDEGNEINQFTGDVTGGDEEH